MDQWASLYANLSTTAPALTAATPSSSSSSSRHRPHARHHTHPLDRRTHLQALEAQARLPVVLTEESDPEEDNHASEEDDDEEVEIEEDELYEVLQESKNENQRNRKYANSTFLSPPAPYLHRSLNSEGFAERQRLRRYESYSARPRSASPSQGVPERYSLPRSMSMPVVPTTSVREQNTAKVPMHLSKPRKARPSPLDLVPHLSRPWSPDSNPSSTASPPSTSFSVSKSPYPATSILALYSPSLPTSPIRTLSLPPFTFASSDFPSPSGRVRVSSPFPMSMSTPPPQAMTTPPMQSQTGSKNSSPRTSVASSASSRTSMSSVRQEMNEMNYTLPTPPLPSATFLAKKERIHYTLSPNELSRRI